MEGPGADALFRPRDAEPDLDATELAPEAAAAAAARGRALLGVIAAPYEAAGAISRGW